MEKKTKIKLVIAGILFIALVALIATILILSLNSKR